MDALTRAACTSTAGHRYDSIRPDVNSITQPAAADVHQQVISMTLIDPFQGVPAALADAMREHGFSELTSVQRSVLDAESSGRDLRISSQTGSGKTVALGLALAPHFLESAAKGAKTQARRGPAALVIAPTRELAVQVAEELSWLYQGIPGLKIVVVTGGAHLGRERMQLASRPTLVVGTPGRLLDHHRNRALDCSSVEHVVLDEADRMLDMGFREELEAIVEALPEKRRSHLLSATFPAGVRRLADRFQHDVLSVEGTRLGAANADIEHVAFLVKPRDIHAALVNLLLLAEDSRCLLFVKRRVDAANISEKLAADGFAAMPISGDLPQSQRTRTLNAFRKGTIHILVATDVAARGIDVPDIGSVIHIDPPSDTDTYTHRSGRTGRAGRKGRSLLLVPPAEQRRVKRVLAPARIDIDWQTIPSPGKVRKALQKRSRRALRLKLDAGVEPGETQRAWAAQLLAEGRDAETVIATLLENAGPQLPCEPIDVQAIDATAAHRPRNAPGYVRFSLNWGKSSGATPSRVLSHVCRRGGVAGRLIGSIDIRDREASFDVVASVADSFEARSHKPDARDPKITIHRSDTGAQPPTPRKGGHAQPGSARNAKPHSHRKPSLGSKRFKGKTARRHASK
jgi:ATP-dependent RNA helicase DeaD